MIEIETTGLRELRNELAVLQADVPREMTIAMRKAAKRGRTIAARGLAKLIRQKIKTLKGAIRTKVTDGSAELLILGRYRVALRRFNPRQARKGVTVKPYKKTVGGSAKLEFPGAFMGPRPGVNAVSLRGQPMRRDGKDRLPISAIEAVRPVVDLRSEAYILNGIIVDLSDEIVKEVNRRIRYLELKAAGKLRGRQPS